MRSSSLFVAIAAALSLACAGRAWDRVRAEDTAAAYHGYLREHPDSERAGEARARLALVRLRHKPSAEGYDAFRAEFPDAGLLAEARPIVEQVVFERVRATGTPEAYREFLEEFADGEYAERARGNAEFLAARGFGASPSELSAFASRHPSSDFATEARRSAEAVAKRSRSAFQTVALRIEIAPGTASPERLARVFAERAQRRYAEVGLALVPDGGRDAHGVSPSVQLTIRHREETVRSSFVGGAVSTPGIIASTSLTLTRSGDPDPIWSDTFEFRATGAPRTDTSVLFGPGTQSYWASFFVPVATWDTSAAVRAARRLEKPIADVAVAGMHAIVLYTDGDLEMFDLGDPEQPFLLGAYRHKRDLTRWSGLHVAGDRIVLFGPDGLEVVALREGHFAPVQTIDRGVVGTILAVESFGGDLVVAGNRGLQQLDAGTGQLALLLDRPLLGLARVGDRLLFSDGTSLYVTTRSLLREQRIEAELRLGRGFGPGLLRVDGDHVIVLGQRGVALVDVSVPSRPQLRSRVEATEAGQVRDAARIGGRLFLLGERGLQLTDAGGTRVIDSACVATRLRIAPAGRHLVMTGERALQVVDATPFVAGAALAAPLP